MPQMHKTNGCYFLLMPFLQITRGTSPKKDIKILYSRVLTCTPRMKHVLLGEIFTPRGALGSLRSRPVTQRSLQFLGEERCVTRQKRLQRRLRVTRILMESCWFWVWLILHPEEVLNSITRDTRSPAAQLSALSTELILPRQAIRTV